MAAPALDPTVGSTTFDAGRFLLTAQGVDPDRVDAVRVAIVRGRVLTDDPSGPGKTVRSLLGKLGRGLVQEARSSLAATTEANPLAGVRVSVVGHPELGSTTTAADGTFSLAVLGGSSVSVRMEREGYPSVQRTLPVQWQQWGVAPDVILTPYDNNVSRIDFSAPVQVARGSTVTDASGTRRATLLFHKGTVATMHLPDGTKKTLPEMHVRVTEYTVGINGPNAMPMELPPASAYTWCAELSADEAIAAKATQVSFSNPVCLYVENFLQFPVGVAVPTGVQDRTSAGWAASSNGIVLRILSTNNGLATLDVNGDGKAADAAMLERLGIGDAERRTLAGMYSAGQELWRTQLEHFSSADLNWGWNSGPNPAPGPPPPPAPDVRFDTPTESPCNSTIQVENQTLGEDVALTGVPFGLHYQSDRVPGHKSAFGFSMKLTPDTLPVGLRRVDVVVEIAGTTFKNTFVAEGSGYFGPSSGTLKPGHPYSFTWDGMDAFGRRLHGEQPATVRVGYVYLGYYDADYFMGVVPNSFGVAGSAAAAKAGKEASSGGAMIPPPTIMGFTVERQFTQYLGQPAQPIGGWSLDIHHLYDPQTQTLVYGDGRKRSGLSPAYRGREFASVPRTLTIAGGVPKGSEAGGVRLDNITGVSVGPDGMVYVAADNQVKKLSRDGTVSTVAGAGSGGTADGVPATAATFRTLSSVFAAADGSIYVADHNLVRRIDVDGIIRTVAGGGTNPSADGINATDADLGIHALCEAVAPDGTLYVADSDRGIVFRVGPSGTIHRVAGGGWQSEDGIPARDAWLGFGPVARLAPDGSLYICDHNSGRVRRVGADGVITTVAGFGKVPTSIGGDGSLATSARINPVDVAFEADGSFYVCDDGKYRGDVSRVRYVDRQGVIRTVAGGSTGKPPTMGVVPTSVSLDYPSSVAVAPDGSMYFADRFQGLVYRVTLPFPQFDPSKTSYVASEDGTQVFVFDSRGRHQYTTNALTGAKIWTFSYDENSRLTSVTDADGNTTRLLLDTSGNITSIVAPGGQTTILTYDANGWLSSIADPENNTRRFTYSDKGLLLSYVNADGHKSTYEYDERGRLIKDSDPVGGFVTLTRSETDKGWEVKATSALGRTLTYRIEEAAGIQTRVVTDALGGQEVTLTYGDRHYMKTTPDGTLTEVELSPDPRFGFQAPYESWSMVVLPSGLQSVRSNIRTATLADSNGPPTLKTLNERTIVNGRTYLATFTASNRTLITKTPEGRTGAMVVDGAGRPVSIQKGDLAPTVTSYDSKGYPIHISQGPVSVSFEYDEANRPVSLTDALGNKTTFGYDRADRPVSVTLPSGGRYECWYDGEGNLRGARNPSGSTIEQVHTPLGQLASFVLPTSGSIDFHYDEHRKLVSLTLPDGRTRTYDWCGCGRPEREVSPEGDTEITYFDTTSRPGSVVRSPRDGQAQKTFFNYDGPLLTRLAYSGPASCDLAYAYDNNFLLTQIRQAGVPFAITRDNDGLITSFGQFAFARSGPQGVVSAITDKGPSGTLTYHLSYDSVGRPLTRSCNTGNTPFYDIALDYDRAGRIATKTETIAGTRHIFEYAYDADGQLVQVKRDGPVFESHEYDVNGNRTRSQVGANAPESAIYDSEDRLLSRGQITYETDRSGFVVKRGSDTFAYSADGELLSAAAGGQTVNYGYDGHRRMVTRTQNGKTLQIFYRDASPGSRVISTVDPDGTTIYFYDDADRLFALQRGPTMYYVGSDALGTPRVVVDANATVMRVIDYDSFGNVLSDSNPAFYLAVGFAGGIPDNTTGLVRFGARDYDPAAARWTARDPILLKGGQFNLYTYVGNDPLAHSDGNGLAAGPQPTRTPTPPGWKPTPSDPAAEAMAVLGVLPLGKVGSTAVAALTLAKDIVDTAYGEKGAAGKLGWDSAKAGIDAVKKSKGGGLASTLLTTAAENVFARRGGGNPSPGPAPAPGPAATGGELGGSSRGGCP